MQRVRDDCAEPTVHAFVHNDVPGDPREHVTDGSPCWCQPVDVRVLPRKRLEPRR